MKLLRPLSPERLALYVAHGAGAVVQPAVLATAVGVSARWMAMA